MESKNTPSYANCNVMLTPWRRRSKSAIIWQAWGGDVHRRELFRQTLLGAAGLATVGPPRAEGREFPLDSDASKELARTDWKPVFLDDHQNETLIVLSDLIIPKTDTPGAQEALANRFIDRLLAAETPETQRAFVESLAYLDGECMSRYHSAFRYTPVESQVAVLRYLAYPHSLGTWGSEGHAEFGMGRPAAWGIRGLCSLRKRTSVVFANFN